jgi:hypothetical protein
MMGGEVLALIVGKPAVPTGPGEEPALGNENNVFLKNLSYNSLKFTFKVS